MIRSKVVKDTKKKVLRSAEELVSGKTDGGYVEDLSRTGVVWAGILELTDPISPSEVAAMLCSHDLVRATRIVDSEDHWISAAAYAALGAAAEPGSLDSTREETITLPAVVNTVGFSAARQSHES